jgi:hypothetical protein
MIKNDKKNMWKRWANDSSNVNHNATLQAFSTLVPILDLVC